MQRPTLEVIVLVALLGCTPDVGDCDPDDALRLAYDEQGVPALAGQALMTQSCASGYCHDSGLSDPEALAGAPAGLTFDVRLVSSDPASFVDTATENARVARLDATRFRILQMRGEIWDQVHSGRMPPWDWDNPPTSAAAEETSALRGAYEAAVGGGYQLVANEAGDQLEPLPGLDDEEGREIFRNWLACGAPMVERTEERPDRISGGTNLIVPTCERTCVGVTWPSIVQGILEPRCAFGGCHDDSANPAGALSLMGTPDELHARLLDAAPEGAQCATGATTTDLPYQGTPLLTAGEPDVSLLLMKSEVPSDAICGSRMPVSGNPLSDQRLCVLREWIACGACPEGDGGACRACLEDPDLLARCNLAAFSEDPAGFACADAPACQGLASF